MPVIRVVTEIHAPMEACFDLARDIEVHIRSTAGTDEKAVGGVTSGLIGLGQEVTWEARHFGIRQRLTSRITVFDYPRHFRDSQVCGVFRRFDHDHLFEGKAAITTMTDVFDYEAPMKWVGRLADGLFLKAYMRRLLERRAGVIKAAAEAFAG
jgi:ligand-binding SRPBCC domain-containing protein